jgi:hypothetical protein
LGFEGTASQWVSFFLSKIMVVFLFFQCLFLPMARGYDAIKESSSSSHDSFIA